MSQLSVVETSHSSWFGERPYIVDEYMKISLPSGQLMSRLFPSHATARPEKMHDNWMNVIHLSTLQIMPGNMRKLYLGYYSIWSTIRLHLRSLWIASGTFFDISPWEFINSFQQESPQAGNRTRRTAPSVTPFLAWGGLPLSWSGGTLVLAEGYLSPGQGGLGAPVLVWAVPPDRIPVPSARTGVPSWRDMRPESGVPPKRTWDQSLGYPQKGPGTRF